MDSNTLKHYLADSPPSIVPLAIKPHFEALEKQAQLYAHYLSHASFAGTRIVLRQVSPESEHIYDMIIALHHHCNGDWKAVQQQAGVSDQELEDFLNYAAQFLGNCGNYKSFGDVKFVPRIAEEKFAAIANVSEAAGQLFEKAKTGIFPSTEVAQMHLGYPDQGHMTTYYPDSPSITKDDITAVSEFLDEKGLLPENTRIRKTSSSDFEVLIASAETNSTHQDLKQTEFELSGKKIKLVFGDYHKEMAKISHFMAQAQKHAANDTEKNMTGQYHESFKTGSLEAFKESQRYWIKDKGPMVETNIGFIETYRDPHGIRGEWEGFVAMVNQERTRAFSKLVEAAPEMIPKLPWGKEFEKDKFLSPDFTSLEVLTFAGSGITCTYGTSSFGNTTDTS